jgi:hypothetical protein
MTPVVKGPKSIFQGDISPFFVFKLKGKPKPEEDKELTRYISHCITFQRSVITPDTPVDAHLLNPKSKTLNSIETCSRFGQEMMDLHRKLVNKGALCAVHAPIPHDVIINMGGFILTTPLFEKIVSMVNPHPDQSLLWKQIIKILRTFNNHSPLHICLLTKHRHLVDVFSYCLKTGCKIGLMNSEPLVTEMKEIITMDRQYILSHYDSVKPPYKELLRTFYPRFFIKIILDP